MNRRNFAKTAMLITIFVGAATNLVRADRLQLQEKLGREVSIQLNNVTITEALEKIGQKAGVKFILSDEAIWRLPYGEATRLSVSLNGPLADSMTEMLNAFFMRYAVGDEEITIYPKPELEHILGKASTRQLELLRDIYTKPIKTYFVGDVQKTINKALGQEVMVLVAREHDLNRFFGSVLPGLIWKDDKKKYEPNEAGKQCELAAPITVRQLLDQAASLYQPPFRWYISEAGLQNEIPQIKMVDYQAFNEVQLGQKVDVLYKNERAEIILQNLVKRIDAELDVMDEEPSWRDEKISVDMQNITLGQAIRNVVSAVNGKYGILTDRRPTQIQLYGLKGSKKTDDGKEGRIIGRVDSGTGGCGYAGKISIPMDDGRYFIEFMLQECDMPEQLKALRAEKMKEILGEWPAPAKKKEPSVSRSDANAVQGPKEEKSPAEPSHRRQRQIRRASPPIENEEKTPAEPSTK